MDPRYLPSSTPSGKSPFESSLCIPSSQNIKFETSPRLSVPQTYEVLITDFDKIKDGREAYYRYHIQVNSQKKSPHRYSEFEWLRNQLSLKYPGCITPQLPPKEGVSSYIYNHEASFYEYRKHGLELFLRSVAAHPRLNTSLEFRSFIDDDELNFGMKVRDSQERSGVFTMLLGVSSSVASTVSYLIYGDNSGGSSISEIDSYIETGYQALRRQLEAVEVLCTVIVFLI
jgi:hypothetical protein